MIFQSTLPVGGATRVMIIVYKKSLEFQSTLPVGGATVSSLRCVPTLENFNPRSPWGERRIVDNKSNESE